MARVGRDGKPSYYIDPGPVREIDRDYRHLRVKKDKGCKFANKFLEAFGYNLKERPNLCASCYAFPECCDKTKVQKKYRDEAIAYMYLERDFTREEIATFWGLSLSTIDNIIPKEKAIIKWNCKHVKGKLDGIR